MSHLGGRNPPIVSLQKVFTKHVSKTLNEILKKVCKGTCHVAFETHVAKRPPCTCQSDRHTRVKRAASHIEHLFLLVLIRLSFKLSLVWVPNKRLLPRPSPHPLFMDSGLPRPPLQVSNTGMYQLWYYILETDTLTHPEAQLGATRTEAQRWKK